MDQDEITGEDNEDDDDGDLLRLLNVPIFFSFLDSDNEPHRN